MNENKDFYPLPQPDEISVREKEDAMGAYLMMFASVAVGLPLPIINLVAATVYFFINKSGSRFVRFHSLQSLISQIPVTILNAVAVYWFITDVLINHAGFTDMFKSYLVMIVIINLSYFIFSIIGAVKARKGKFYYFFFFGKLSYLNAYSIKEEQVSQEHINKPPA